MNFNPKGFLNPDNLLALSLFDPLLKTLLQQQYRTVCYAIVAKIRAKR